MSDIGSPIIPEGPLPPAPPPPPPPPRPESPLPPLNFGNETKGLTRKPTVFSGDRKTLEKFIRDSSVYIAANEKIFLLIKPRLSSFSPTLMEEKPIPGKNTSLTDISYNQMVHTIGQPQTKSSLVCEPTSRKKMKLKNHLGNWKRWNKDPELPKKLSMNSESSNHKQGLTTILLQYECSEGF